MPHLLPDGSPPPPKNVRESIMVKNDAMFGAKSVGLNQYKTSEVVLFDKQNDPLTNFVANKGKSNEASYSRTAHSEGEMFGLSKFDSKLVCALPISSSFDANDTVISVIFLQSSGRTGM